MNVSGPGGAAGIDPQALKILAETLVEGAERTAARLSDPASLAPAPSDHVSVSFDQLTAAPLQQLIQTIEQRLFSPQAAHAATSRNDVTAAYSRAVQVMNEDIDHITLSQARNTAEKSIARAMEAVETGTIHGPRIPENLDPQIVLALATQMIATQQFPNYLRAAELGNEIASWYDGPLTVNPAFRRDTAGRVRGAEFRLELRWVQSLRKWWNRAPMLVLLGGWLLTGVVGAIVMRFIDISASDSSLFFNIWATGFLALIVLQFVLTVRGGLRRKSRW